MTGRLHLDPDTSPETAPGSRYQISEPLLESVSTQRSTGHVVSPQHGCLTLISCTFLALFLNCAVNGLVTLNISQIASDYDLSPGVELWPMSIYYLAQGCTFLLAGSLTDILGSRRMFLYGCTLQALCHAASGVSKSGVQLITFRALAGVAYPMCFVSAMNIHRDSLPAGRLYDFAVFSAKSSQYLGSAVGLILSGMCSVITNWRRGFFLAAILSVSTLLLSIRAIPRQVAPQHFSSTKLIENIDWAGTLLASLLMMLLFTALAYVHPTPSGYGHDLCSAKYSSNSIITNNVANLSKSGLFIPLALGWLLLIAFLFWQDCWERDNTQGVRDSLWTNTQFMLLGLVVFFIYACSLSTTQLMVLVFQRVQGLSVLRSSWQMLPIPVIGALASALTERHLSRVPASRVLVVTALLSSLAPVLMIVLDVNWGYWNCAVYAVSLNSVAASSIIPIAAMMISENFTHEMQGFAMGVVCTIAMIGASVGMALAALISNDVTATQLQIAGDNVLFNPRAWMNGYRVAFGFLLTLNLAGLIITASCLPKDRRAGHGPSPAR
ncbi:uncharacterized protein N7506_004903 [Penicillium brevicompactum]|uniref:uncharacterized protein n=1 Tax=Penicillium brevicompactum TaxID=5074 RepID=UPI00254243DF|nr:uncharacterized protein N7506_004903 [Penicillium brevicompactum]KAJ5336881.1 hypothetical protein N7506_004903 [Penicillium brevicompactum]